VKTLIGLTLFISLAVSGQNYALHWHPESPEGAPTNCIAEWRDIRGATLTTNGWFTTNLSGLRFHLAFSETNYTAWSSNLTWQSENRLRLLLAEREAIKAFLESNTNVTAITAPTVLSNLVRLRLLEERIGSR
jgi:hypothetical protein